MRVFRRPIFCSNVRNMDEFRSKGKSMIVFRFVALGLLSTTTRCLKHRVI